MAIYTQGLRAQTHTLLDASTKNTMMTKTEVEVKDKIENTTLNEYHAFTNRGYMRKWMIVLDT